MHWCCWCADADALMLMPWCCWCTYATDQMMLLLLLKCKFVYEPIWKGQFRTVVQRQVCVFLSFFHIFLSLSMSFSFFRFLIFSWCSCSNAKNWILFQNYVTDAISCVLQFSWIELCSAQCSCWIFKSRFKVVKMFISLTDRAINHSIDMDGLHIRIENHCKISWLNFALIKNILNLVHAIIWRFCTKLQAKYELSIWQHFRIYSQYQISFEIENIEKCF